MRSTARYLESPETLVHHKAVQLFGRFRGTFAEFGRLNSGYILWCLFVGLPSEVERDRLAGNGCWEDASLACELNSMRCAL